MPICIFDDVTKCNGVSSEHLIQEGLGGRHESQHVLCDSCNHFFGEKIDPGLCTYYSLIIDVLRSLMPSELKSITRHVSSVGEGVQLTRKQGGIVMLKKIHKIYKPDGTLQAVYSPTNLATSKIQEIALADGMKGPPKFPAYPV